jgi:hypothetical protein
MFDLEVMYKHDRGVFQNDAEAAPSRNLQTISIRTKNLKPQ